MQFKMLAKCPTKPLFLMTHSGKQTWKHLIICEITDDMTFRVKRHIET